MRKLVCYLLIIFTTPAFANQFFCMKHGGIIKNGDTTAQVEQACGKPLTVQQKIAKTLTRQAVTQWVYLDRALKLLNPPTMKISFIDNQVSKIRANNTFLGQASCYNHNRVQVGDSPQAVRLACGNPDFAYTYLSNKPAIKHIIEWTFQNGALQPKTYVDFENGVVVAIRFK